MAEERGADSVVENVKETAFDAAKTEFLAAESSVKDALEAYDNLNNAKEILTTARANFNAAKNNGS